MMRRNSPAHDNAGEFKIMTASSKPYSGTYFVQDQGNEEEFLRQMEQDRLVTTSMGGALAEQQTPHLLKRVLDVACGVGGWAIEAAQTYPAMSLVGIDINPRMIDYAREQAAVAGLAERVEFLVTDALRPLDFPDASFDLVNMRFAMSFVRTWEWPRLISNFMRVLRPGGIIRLTEEQVIHESNSPASVTFCELLLGALYRSGHLFAQESTGLTSHLSTLLRQQSDQEVQIRQHVLHFQAGTPEGQIYIRDGNYIIRTLRPFLEKWGMAGENYAELAQRVRAELQQPDFSATWCLTTVWASKAREIFA
jgi:ubiquinone/menaquinone biosynthesis C-methylase UbiE